MARLELTRLEAANGQLPLLCMRCGAPAVVLREKRFFWSRPWIDDPYHVLLYAFTTRSVIVRMPFCERHQDHYFGRTIVHYGGGLALVTLCFLSVVLDWFSPFFIFMGLAFWLIPTVILYVTGIRAVSVTQGSISLIGVSPEFVAAHQASHQSKSARERSGSGA